MKKYTFPTTLALVCFIGGYLTCYSRVTLAEQEQALLRNQYNESWNGMTFRTARLEASKMPTRVVLGPDALVHPVNPKVEGWNQGLIAPMIPPKRVAP